MKRIEDERLKFYLRHQDLIDEWAKLAALVPDQVHDFLASCNGALTRLASELGPDIKFEYWGHGNYPTYGFYRPTWCNAEGPYVGIGIQWHRAKVAFKGENAPRSGVWLYGDGKKPADQLLQAFHSRCDRPREGFAKADAWAAAVRRERPPNEDYWDDLDPYKNSLVESVRSAWKLYAHDIDEVLRSIQP
jgi:hypothetical protein